MPSNLLLLLPLLSGYAFIHLCYGTRYRAQALSGHRLIFEASIAGLLWLIPARLFVIGGAAFLANTGHLSQYWNNWRKITGDTDFVGTLCIALVLAPVCAVVWNRGRGWWLQRGFDGKSPEWLPPEENRGEARHTSLEVYRAYALNKAIQNSGNELLILLHEAAIRARSEERLAAQFLMKDGKVYVGWIQRSPNLSSDDQYVPVCPTMSGFRDSQTKKVYFTTSYPVEAYDDPGFHLGEKDFRVVLPVSEIVGVRLFDEQLYLAYFFEDEDENLS